MQKLILLFFCFLLLGSNVSAQTEVEDTAVILAAIDKEFYGKPIIYAEKYEQKDDSDFYHLMKKGVFKMPKSNTPSLILSTEEINFLIEKHNKPTVWKEHLFANSLMIDNDSNYAYATKGDWVTFLSSADPEGTYFYKYKAIFNFSKPIYFRKKHFAYFEFHVLTDGGALLNIQRMVLKKVNNKWRRLKWIDGIQG